jgi:hypothetical protein
MYKKQDLLWEPPNSSVFSKIYLQHAELTLIYDILVQNNILGYFRYVDDILTAYNASSVTDIYRACNSSNNIFPKMKFTVENEIDKKIIFLHITIHKQNVNLAFNIYRKPTTTDIAIRGDSCHHQEQKHAAITILTNIVNTSLPKWHKQAGWKQYHWAHFAQ